MIEKIFKKKKEKYIKTSDKYFWDGFSPEIYEVILRDDYHIIVTFKNGIIKDVNARIFIDDKKFGTAFDEIRDNIDLFMNPRIVDGVGIVWTDMADIAEYGLWKDGKTIGTKKVVIKKIAFPRIKTFSDKISLENRSDKKIHSNTPHFHVLKNNKEIGQVFVGMSEDEIEKNKNNNRRYLKQLRKLQKYTNDNAKLLTKIYKAQDGLTKHCLAKELPNTYE